jgi:hypothetical protein
MISAKLVRLYLTEVKHLAEKTVKTANKTEKERNFLTPRRRQ